MFTSRVLLATLLLVPVAAAQEDVSFPTEDGGVVYAGMYGQGERGIVLAHGGRFNKESWGQKRVGCRGKLWRGCGCGCFNER